MFGRDFCLAKADSLGPLGPCMVTADELTQPRSVRIRSWQNDQRATNYRLARARAASPSSWNLRPR
jgi:2-keto-4-pentenoate hydratase/2-oxohepta-3-ene-1,7-dioic acid hydratase in catechol pathway